ncbi:MAG: ABC transporter permease [Eubacteriales bacterium]|nr:ABC transporter permease [Eubacteriales bacterium]
MFYLKLACSNLKKNHKNYLPFFLTCMITVMLFYMMDAISRNSGLQQMPASENLQLILEYATWITGGFAAVFLFYTNSFLIKQRKKEFGLYQVLGMDKKNLTWMMAFESVLLAGGSIAGGLLGGIVFGKLLFLILLKMIHFEVVLSFAIEKMALLRTAGLFFFIFLVLFLWNLIQIQRTTPAELLHGQNQGEREPKTKLLLTLVGIATMGSGYFLALTTETPLSAIGKFFIAVALVIVGTYALFTAGSIAFLKILKKRKPYYYQTRHFITVSGMMYRMKQNAVGLANICIMSTIVIVLVSVTVSLYAGMENVIMTRFPSELYVEVSDSAQQQEEVLETILSEETKRGGVEREQILAYHNVNLPSILDGDKLILEQMELDDSYKDSGYRNVILLPLEDYNAMEQEKENLEDGQVLVYFPADTYRKETVTLQDHTYQVKKVLSTISIEERDAGYVVPNVYIVMPDLKELQMYSKKYAYENAGTVSYTEYFDLSGNSEQKESVILQIKQRAQKELEKTLVQSREEFRESGYSLYGGFLFLGVFVGALFLMATVLVIYYKQISEGYDDRERYQIMKKVGLDELEIRKAIQSQIRTVFFLPLVVAMLHMAAAFPALTKIMAALNLVNVRLEAVCTVGTVIVFAVFYGIVFVITSREYYKIVR